MRSCETERPAYPDLQLPPFPVITKLVKHCIRHSKLLTEEEPAVSSGSRCLNRQASRCVADFLKVRKSYLLNTSSCKQLSLSIFKRFISLKGKVTEREAEAAPVAELGQEEARARSPCRSPILHSFPRCISSELDRKQGSMNLNQHPHWHGGSAHCSTTAGPLLSKDKRNSPFSALLLDGHVILQLLSPSDSTKQKLSYTVPTP